MIAGIALKHHLPNDGVFDDKRNFAVGPLRPPIMFRDIALGVMICEDMWASSFHKLDPARDLEALKPFDGVINLSASPYDVAKGDKRRDRARVLSHLLEAPLYGSFRFGGQQMKFSAKAP